MVAKYGAINERVGLKFTDHSTIFICYVKLCKAWPGGGELCSLLNQKCLSLEDVSGSSCQTQLDGVRLGSHFVWLSCILSASGVVCRIKLYFISFKRF